MYEGDQLTQVKTYTDNGNGYGQRSGGTTHYSKVIFHFPYQICIIPKNRIGNYLLILFDYSFRQVVNVLIPIWIHNQLKVKIVKRRPHYKDITQIFIYLQWRPNHRDMFECIMLGIVHTRDKGHYANER